MAKFPVQSLKHLLAGSGINSTVTSITVRTLQFPDGSNITMTEFGDIGYATIEPGTTRVENISFTGITQNSDGTATLTGVTRGVDFHTPYSGDAARAMTHSGGTTIIFSNSAAFYKNILLNPTIAATIDALYTFTTVPQAEADPVGDDDLARRSWVLAQVNGGDVSTDSLVIVGTAGETVAAGEYVYLNAADGEWYLVDADNNAHLTGTIKGVAQGAGSDGVNISNGIMIAGRDASISYTTGQVYYASNTAGGLSTSAGTYQYAVGIGDTENNLVMLPKQTELTIDEKAALAGSRSTPNTDNKYLTEDHLLDAFIDQSQTTNDGSVEVGETDSALRKRLLAQSFIPTKTKIRGVRLRKEADTGTFSGTMKFALQADDGSGDPSGSDLASVTLTNTQWDAIASDADFDAVFSTEYTSLVVGDTYWIVITPSTANDTNHPNLGTNTAGGYANGSVKYNNTNDGWTAIATIDLTFSTIEGRADQIVTTDENGLVQVQARTNKLGLYTTQVELPTSNGSDQNFFSTTIPANLLNGNAVRARMYITGWTDDGNTLTLKLKYGSTTVVSFNLTTNMPSGIDAGWVNAIIVGTGVETQKGHMEIELRDAGVSESASELARYYQQGTGTATEDSSGDLTFAIAVNTTSQSGNDITVDLVTVELIR